MNGSPADLPPMRDVTSQFLSACQDLQFGEMIKLPDLSMMEAMNALVMLDPRMDSGCSENSPKDEDEAEEELSELELTPGVVCGVMDRLLQLEMTYHTGAPLVQTLFTSRHLLQLHPLTSTLLNAGSTPDDLLNQIIIPYMHSFRLCMYLVWTELTRGHMYDGEDFASDTAGLWEGGKEWSVPRLGLARGDGVDSEGDGLGYDECDLMLEDVVERMEQGLEWLETAGYTREEVDHLKARIHFRKELLSHLIVVLAASYQIMPIPYPSKPLSEAYRHLEPLLARPLSLSENEQAKVDRAFDPTVYRRFRQMMPLPKIEILEGKRFRDQLGDLVKDIGLCERLAQCGDFDEWERELIALSVGERPTLPFVRSCMISNLTPTPTTLVTGLALPRSAIQDHFFAQAGLDYEDLEQVEETMVVEGPEHAKRFEQWRKLLSGHWLGYLINLLHNRPRSRRALLSSMANWDDLHERLPRMGDIRRTPSILAALERQRLFIGLLGMLGGLDNELWSPGPVGRDEKGRLQAGGEPEMLAMVFWWIREIAERYVRPPEPSDWKFLWMATWYYIASGMYAVLSSIEENERESSKTAKEEESRSNAQRPRSKEIFEVRFKHFIQEDDPSSMGTGQLTAMWPAWQKEWSKRGAKSREDEPDSETWRRANVLLGKLTSPLDEGCFKALCVVLQEKLNSLADVEEPTGSTEVVIPSLDNLEQAGLPRSLMWIPLVSKARRG